MDAGQVATALFLMITMVALTFAAVKVIIRIKRDKDMLPSFRCIVKWWLGSGLTTDFMIHINLLLSTITKGWPAGLAFCEFWGFITTTMTANFAWMICIAVFERYCAILAPNEVVSTFSKRNTVIINVGLLLLVLMACTGPFYGFGEYTYLRGYFSVLVSTNITLPFSLVHQGQQDEMKLESLHQLFSHLRRSSYVSREKDALSVLSEHLQNSYNFIVNEATWLPHGISFEVRAISAVSVDKFIRHYNDKIIGKNLTELSFIEDIAKTINISDTLLTADVSETEIDNYRQNYFPLQDVGLCTADLTTPNRYTSLWIGFYTMIVFVLPYCTSLTCLCLLYIRGFGQDPAAVKRVQDSEVSYTNVTSTVCMLTCLIYLIYFVVILSNAAGEFTSSNLVFWTTYGFGLKSFLLIIALRYGVKACTFHCACCQFFVRKLLFWRSPDHVSYELTDLETTQSLTGKVKRKSLPA